MCCGIVERFDCSERSAEFSIPERSPTSSARFSSNNSRKWASCLRSRFVLIFFGRVGLDEPPVDPEHRAYLMQQAEAFLFGGDVDAAEGYTPPA